MFAVIDLPAFGLQAVLRREPPLRGPAALVESVPGQGAKALVVECNESAHAAGVPIGSTLPQAMARCTGLVMKSRHAAAEQEAATALLQTAHAFTPHIEHTAPGVCTMDLRGLRWDGDAFDITSENSSDASQQAFGFLEHVESAPPDAAKTSLASAKKDHPIIAWAEKILAALQQLNLTGRIGVGATPNVALLAAQSARSGTVRLVEHTADFFKKLPIEALSPVPRHLGILKRWGIHNAGAFLALGQDAIAERLGTEALEMFERAGTVIRPLHTVVPPDTFEEHMDFEVQVETLEPLLFVLRRFIEQLATRIALTYRVVAELDLKLTLESGALYARTFKVPCPTANVDTLFRMLHTHLENLHTDAPIVSLQLSALPARAQSQQFSLFESALRDPNHFHETLARLTALLGSDRAGTPIVEATHRPDAFQMKTPDFATESQDIDTSPKAQKVSKSSAATPATAARNAQNTVTSPTLGLCLRRFRNSLHAEVELEQGRPVFFSTFVVRGGVRQSRGPWLGSGTWWDQRRWSRQEWDVETHEGALYRLFHANDNWLVEGTYD